MPLGNLWGFTSSGKKIKIGDVSYPPVSLTVSGDWENTQYEGSPVDPTGLTFTATSAEGVTEVVTPTSVSPETWGTGETQTATFYYTEDVTTVSVSKSASVYKTLLSISITTPPSKTSYNQGDTFDSSGSVVTALWGNGVTTDVTSECTWSPSTLSTVGAQVMTASYTYGGVTKTDTTSVNVYKIPALLTVSGDWENSQYIDTAPDITGLTFTCTYSDNTTSTVTPTSISPSTWSSTVGTQTATFSYTERNITVTATKDANVENIIPISLVVTGDWTNDQSCGSAPDITGLTFTANLIDGTNRAVTPSVSPSIWASSGTQTATFSYTLNGVTVSTTKTANVYNAISSIAITTQPTKTTYNHNETFDSTGAVITATWADGTTSDVTSSTTWSPTTLSTVGTQTITASYTYRNVTKTATTSVTVNKVLISIAITTQPTTRTYNYGSTFDSTGAVITATYSDSTTEDVTLSTTWSPSVLESHGSVTITASYTYNSVTETDTTTVTVNKIPSSLTVGGSWSNDQFINESVDTTGLTFTCTYSDGSTDLITPSSVSPLTWGSIVGTQTATFTYTESGVTVSATKDASVVRKLTSLTIGGSWSNPQYTGQSVDYTGLTFTANYNNGTSATVSPTSYSPITWSSTVGTQTCTFSYIEDGVTVSASKSVSVQNAVDPVLDNNSWETIKSVADAGIASQYWSVGDYKNISVAAGRVDTMSVVASTYRAVIIGINHNPTYENPNSIDFAIGQNTSGTDICFRDGGNSVRMNTSNVTTGGWTGSQMYLTYLPQFYNLLSGNIGLQSAMIAPKKYTHNNTGGSDNNTAANVTLSEDANYKMFLMAEFEIFGTRIFANSYEQNKQAQYAYYSSSGLAKSKVRYRTDTGDANYWWGRSAYCYNSKTDSFCGVNSSGSYYNTWARNALGLCPCFRV